MSKVDIVGSEIVLSYYDCLLRQSDMNLLNGPHWLNDNIIGFYFQYLENTFHDDELKCLFTSPELTQILKMSNTLEYSIFLDPLKAEEKDYVFFPLNNCNDRDSSGGSHWSLLVFSKNEKACLHFDSANGFNMGIAQEFSRKLMNFLLQNDSGVFMEMQFPQQNNAYDCGIYVLCGTDLIIEHIQLYKQIADCNFCNLHSLVCHKRNTLKELINRLKENS